MEIRAKCVQCGGTGVVYNIDENDWVSYLNEKRLVQDVFYDLDDNDREVIVGARSGMYICPTCWDLVFSEED